MAQVHYEVQREKESRLCHGTISICLTELAVRKTTNSPFQFRSQYNQREREGEQLNPLIKQRRDK